jgi:hypothetical protein
VSQSKAKQDGGLAGRARGVIVMAVPTGQRASAAAAQQVQRGVHHARRWSAPRIEGFADIVETTIAPRVTSSLRQGAQTVRPEQESRLRSVTRSMMGWRGLVALLAALGAAGAVAGFAMRKRYTSATEEAEKASANAPAMPMMPADGAVPAQATGDAANGDHHQADSKKGSVGSGW